MDAASGPEPGPEPKDARPQPGQVPPPDTRADTVEDRLRAASVAALKARRRRIDALLDEIARPVGAAALMADGIDACPLLDLDRVLRKIDRVDRETQDLVKAAKKPEGIIESISQDLSRLADALATRELKAKREHHVAELGLALLATDPLDLDRRTPALAALARKHAEDATRANELFRQLELVDEELARRAREGKLSSEPKELDKLVGAASDAVSSAGRAATDRLKELSKDAAKSAARSGSRAVLGLAKRALGFGQKEPEENEDEEDERPRRARPAAAAEPAPASPSRDVPTLDVPKVIRELARLRDEGLLTKEEFEAKKRDLLGRL